MKGFASVLVVASLVFGASGAQARLIDFPPDKKPVKAPVTEPAKIAWGQHIGPWKRYGFFLKICNGFVVTVAGDKWCI